jgi:hypothetical protein
MREIFKTKAVLEEIKEISEKEEDDYSDIPGFYGEIDNFTDRAVQLKIGQDYTWFPYSQLRKAEDGQSIYASTWKKGL